MMAKQILHVGAAILSHSDVRMRPTDIVIEDGKISAVSDHTSEIDPTASVVHRPHHVAIPGFVNTHGHAAMTLLRGAGDDLSLQDWLSQKVYPMEAKLTGDAVYWGTQLACWEMIRSGTTCFTDMYFFMHDAARAVEEAGLRGVLSWGMVGFDDQIRQAGLDNAKSLAKQWHRTANGRIQVTLGPHAPYTCPPDYLQEVAALSAELKLPIQIHLSETSLEVQENRDRFGVSPIVHAKNCGLFDGLVLAAHCVHVDDDDIALMKEHHVHVAHNPQSNLKLGSGVAPIVRMKAAGLTVGLGTDGASSNNNLDMFEELRLAATLHKGVLMDPTVIPAAQAFEMATAEGAKAVFLDEGHGTLTPGAPADLTLLTLDSPHFQPTYDLLSNVVYSAGADDVTDVIVAGVWLMKNTEPVTLDVERIRFEVQHIQEVLSTASI